MPTPIVARRAWRARGRPPAVAFLSARVVTTVGGTGGVVVGGSAAHVLPSVTSYGADGGAVVGGSASYVLPSLTAYAGAGGPVVGGSASATYPVQLLDFDASGGGVAGGTAGIVRSTARTAHQPGERYWTFRYELLDGSNVKLADLENVTSCRITQNWFADIKRKAQFGLRESDQEIDYLTARIKPYAQLHLPPYQSNDYVEWPLGVFLLSSPTRESDDTGKVVRDVDGYDQLQVYLDDKVDERYTVPASAGYMESVVTLLGGVDRVVTYTSSTLTADMEWEPGTPKLTIINNLLNALNYNSLSFDEDGRAVVSPYVSPSTRTEEFTYTDDDTSLILPKMSQDLDLFSVPNKWVLVVSNPDQDAVIGTYTNSNPASPTSTVRRGRTIVDYRTEQDAADQAALDAKAARLAFEASQIFESVRFDTGFNPLHSGNDVYRIRYKPLALNSAFSEAEWSMTLEPGRPMTHRARRVVSI